MLLYIDGSFGMQSISKLEEQKSSLKDTLTVTLIKNLSCKAVHVQLP